MLFCALVCFGKNDRVRERKRESVLLNVDLNLHKIQHKKKLLKITSDNECNNVPNEQPLRTCHVLTVNNVRTCEFLF